MPSQPPLSHWASGKYRAQYCNSWILVDYSELQRTNNVHTEYSLTGRRITHQPATGGILNEQDQSSIEAFHRRFPNHFNCKLNGGGMDGGRGLGPRSCENHAFAFIFTRFLTKMEYPRGLQGAAVLVKHPIAFDSGALWHNPSTWCNGRQLKTMSQPQSA
jgi:hypothetical protein